MNSEKELMIYPAEKIIEDVKVKSNVILYTALFLLFIFFSCGSDAEKKFPPQLDKALDHLIISEHESGRFDGVVIVVKNDSIFFEKALGTADRTWSLPMRVGYRFDIASVNKSFIAALIMLGIEENKLTLDDRLVDLLNQYPYTGGFDPGINLHHLLTHTSGLPDYSAVDEDLAAQDFLKFKRLHLSSSEYIDFISRLDPLFLPGEDFLYSNFGYHLLTIILEDLYDQSFAEILQEKICKPLDLIHTFSAVSNQEVHRNVVEAYLFDGEDGKWIRNNFIDLTLGRRIFSTAKDLYLWARAMDDTTLLSAKSLQLMKTNHLSGIRNDISYGYGWVVFDGKGTYRMGRLPAELPYIIHGGSTEGYKSMLINIRQGEYIISFLSNIGDRVDEMELAAEIINLLNDYYQ